LKIQKFNNSGRRWFLLLLFSSPLPPFPFPLPAFAQSLGFQEIAGLVFQTTARLNCSLLDTAPGTIHRSQSLHGLVFQATARVCLPKLGWSKGDGPIELESARYFAGLSLPVVGAPVYFSRSKRSMSGGFPDVLHLRSQSAPMPQSIGRNPRLRRNPSVAIRVWAGFSVNGSILPKLGSIELQSAR